MIPIFLMHAFNGLGQNVYTSVYIDRSNSLPGITWGAGSSQGAQGHWRNAMYQQAVVPIKYVSAF